MYVIFIIIIDKGICNNNNNNNNIQGDLGGKINILGGNAGKNKYMVMSRDQNTGRIHSARIDNSTFERVEEFKYLGTTLRNQNSIAEEIKSRLRSGSACYHLTQNPLSSRLLSKNLNIEL